LINLAKSTPRTSSSTIKNLQMKSSIRSSRAASMEVISLIFRLLKNQRGLQGVQQQRRSDCCNERSQSIVRTTRSCYWNKGRGQRKGAFYFSVLEQYEL
jgi:hypothetical protein